MEQEKTDNLVEETMSPVGDKGADDFFGALEKSVDSAIYDDSVKTASDQPEQPVVQPVETATADQEDHNWQKRYNDSSKEAKKLNKRLRDVEPYMPILDAMKEDPNLVSVVRGYFEGGGQAPVNVKDQLKLGDDFVFDYDEALSDVDSDSAKLFNATVDGVVQKRLGEFAKNQASETKQMSDQNSFRQKHKMNDDDFGEMMDFAENKQLTYDDIYYLMNRDNNEQKIASTAKNEVMSQMQNVRNKPQSAATTGSFNQTTSPSDAVFDSLMGIDKNINEFLND